MPSPNLDRRNFVDALAAAAAGSLLVTSGAADEPKPARTRAGVPPDGVRDLEAMNADIGSLFPPIQQLAQHEYDGSFLSGRHKSLDEFKVAGRALVTEAMSYQPPRVDPKPEIVERQDLGDFIREKILF